MIQTRERLALQAKSLASNNLMSHAHPPSTMRSNKYARLSELIFARSSTFSPSHTLTVDPGRFKWSSKAPNVSPLDPPPERKAEPLESFLCALYDDKSLQEKPVMLMVAPTIDADNRQLDPSGHETHLALDTLSMSSKMQHLSLRISSWTALIHSLFFGHTFGGHA